MIGWYGGAGGEVFKYKACIPRSWASVVSNVGWIEVVVQLVCAGVRYVCAVCGCVYLCDGCCSYTMSEKLI